jgi:hypothetical protein
MSVVLKFTTDVPRRSRREIAPDEPRGEILFFTGVRIERHMDDLVDPQTHSARSAKAGRRRKA